MKTFAFILIGLASVIAALLLLHSRASRAPKFDNVILTTPGYAGMPVATNGTTVTRLHSVVARNTNAPAQTGQITN